MAKQIKRIRDWMLIPGQYQPGTGNSITDVPGVTCAHVTIKDDGACTGLTLISPCEGDVFLDPVPAAVAIGNGFGKLTGALQIEEMGTLESLIGLTNTLSVAAVLQGLVEHHAPGLPEGCNSINIVVGETNDGLLNDIRGFHVKPEHIKQAVNNLSTSVEEGAVGAGTGTVCFGYKGGIGTASRVIPGKCTGEEEDFIIGVLVQSNYSGDLQIYGRPAPSPKAASKNTEKAVFKNTEKAVFNNTEKTVNKNTEKTAAKNTEDGSCMIIVVTNAPMSSRQLKRLAKRGLIGMTNTGSIMSNGSGDFCLAASNHPANRHNREEKGKSYYYLNDSQLNPFFQTCVEAVQEALYNSLTMSVGNDDFPGLSLP